MSRMSGSSDGCSIGAASKVTGRFVLFCTLAAICAGCATSQSLACRAGERDLTLDTLHFGTASPNGPVSSTQWQTFVAQVVSAEFPDGYTVLRAEGAWRGANGELQHEDSYVLQVVHEDNAGADQAIGRVITRYKQQFQQESVLRVRAATCSSF